MNSQIEILTERQAWVLVQALGLSSHLYKILIILAQVLI